MITAIVDQPAPLVLQLRDGVAGKYPKAFIRDIYGDLVEEVDLSHQSDGLYQAIHSFVETGYFTAQYIVYSDVDGLVQDQSYEIDYDLFVVGDGLDAEKLAGLLARGELTGEIEENVLVGEVTEESLSESI